MRQKKKKSREKRERCGIESKELPRNVPQYKRKEREKGDVFFFAWYPLICFVFFVWFGFVSPWSVSPWTSQIGKNKNDKTQRIPEFIQKKKKKKKKGKILPMKMFPSFLAAPCVLIARRALRAQSPKWSGTSLLSDLWRHLPCLCLYTQPSPKQSIRPDFY